MGWESFSVLLRICRALECFLKVSKMVHDCPQRRTRVCDEHVVVPRTVSAVCHPIRPRLRPSRPATMLSPGLCSGHLLTPGTLVDIFLGRVLGVDLLDLCLFSLLTFDVRMKLLSVHLRIWSCKCNSEKRQISCRKSGKSPGNNVDLGSESGGHFYYKFD